MKTALAIVFSAILASSFLSLLLKSYFRSRIADFQKLREESKRLISGIKSISITPQEISFINKNGEAEVIKLGREDKVVVTTTLYNEITLTSTLREIEWNSDGKTKVAWTHEVQCSPIQFFSSIS